MKIKLTTIAACLSIAMFSSSLVIVKSADATDWQTCTIFSKSGHKSELSCMTQEQVSAEEKKGQSIDCKGSITYHDHATCDTFAKTGAFFQGKTYEG